MGQGLSGERWRERRGGEEGRKKVWERRKERERERERERKGGEERERERYDMIYDFGVVGGSIDVFHIPNIPICS